MTTNLNTLTAEDRAVARLTGVDLTKLAQYKASMPAAVADGSELRVFVPTSPPPLVERCIAALVGEAPSAEDRKRALAALGFKGEPKSAAEVRQLIGAKGYGLSPEMTTEQISEQLKRLGIRLAPREPAPEELLTRADRDLCKLTGVDPAKLARHVRATGARAPTAPQTLVTLSARSPGGSCEHRSTVRLSGPDGPAPFCRDCGAAMRLTIGAA